MANLSKKVSLQKKVVDFFQFLVKKLNENGNLDTQSQELLTAHAQLAMERAQLLGDIEVGLSDAQMGKLFTRALHSFEQGVTMGSDPNN